MAVNIKAYRSVSVRDYTDLGQIMMYMTSSQPSTVVYDPSQSTYVPNWGQSNLVITPVIQYNGSTMPLTTTGLTLTYTRKEGSGNATALTTGESVSNGVLTVYSNKLAGVTSGQLTYICKASYTDPLVGVPIETQASLTYTLVTEAPEGRAANITGESVFLYDTNQTLVGSNTIVLTADLTNTSVSQWQYKKADGTFDPFPTTYNPDITGTTLNVYATEQNIWLNGKTAVIKLLTTDGVYDIHQISKVSDGAAGNATVSAVLSNESHYVPCDASGTVLSWNGASTTIHIYEGGSDVTGTWSISTALGSGLTGTYDSTTYTFTPSALTNETSYCDFTCSKTGYATLTKRYVITKTRAGSDGASAVVYSLDASSLTLNKSEAGVFSPTSVTFSAWSRTGNTVTRTAYSGRFKIEESTDGSTYPATAAYTSASNETSKTWTPSSSSVKMVKCTLYASGGTTVALDSQTVVTVNDGATGQNGQDGLNGVSMGLGNYQDAIPCTSEGVASSAKTITIPFYAYAGIQRIAVTAAVGTLPPGITVSSNTPGSTTSDGTLVLSVANNSNLGGTSSGEITITLTATYSSQSQSIGEKFSWVKNLNGVNGAPSVILQVYSEDGGVIHNSVGSTTLKTRLVSGATEVTPTAFQWQKYVNGTYTNISGATNSSLVVSAAMVTDFAFFKVLATYNGTQYSAFYTVDDQSDPYMAYTFATVSEFKNSTGFGAVYTRVYQGGVEVDPIKSTTFSDTPPTSPSSGDFYYHLDTTNKTCVLKTYNGTSWINASSADTFTYKYYRQDKDGNSLDTTTPYKSTRCFYIDPTIINGQMQFICEVS